MTFSYDLDLWTNDAVSGSREHHVAIIYHTSSEGGPGC
jgi:hypothetical protein